MMIVQIRRRLHHVAQAVRMIRNTGADGMFGRKLQGKCTKYVTRHCVPHNSMQLHEPSIAPGSAVPASKVLNDFRVYLASCTHHCTEKACDVSAVP